MVGEINPRRPRFRRVAAAASKVVPDLASGTSALDRLRMTRQDRRNRSTRLARLAASASFDTHPAGLPIERPNVSAASAFAIDATTSAVAAPMIGATCQPFFIR